ncbi:MAG: PD-(D/E)XK nuclease family protein [Thermoleophilia bacterium]
MALGLLVGPANAGKVARLLDRYVEVIDREPFLVVPNRGDVEPIERQLLARSPGLLGGSIGTFDRLFEEVVRPADRARTLTPLQRELLVRDVALAARTERLAVSSRFAGFASALGDVLGELEAGLLDPDDVGGPLGELHAAYRAALDARRLWDRDRLARRAVELLETRFEAWSDRPVLAYGFEDVTGAQWAVLEALAARTEVLVSLPYEPGRPAFEAVRRTADDLARLAGAARIEELRPQAWGQAAPLAHLERALFADPPPDPGAIEGGAVKFLEAAGTRAALELAAEEILELVASGVPAEEIGVVCPDVERVRKPLEVAFGALGVPYAIDGGPRLGRTPFGRALLGLLRFAWQDGTRGDLFAFLRSPYSGIARGRVDFVEGRLRGRGVTDPARVVEEAERLLGRPLASLQGLAAERGDVERVRALAGSMLRSAHGLARPPIGDLARGDLAAHAAAVRALDQLAGWQALGGRVGADELAHALEAARVVLREGVEGRVVVLDLMRARTRRFEAVFVLGLEEGVLPRRSVDSPFLPDERRRELDAAGSRRRLVRADALARDRYLFYTACTRARARLTLVREAATDEGRPLEPSPFWEEVRGCFEPADVERATRRRALSALAWEVRRAPTERERLRAVATLAAEDERAARELARANGWERRVERALLAFSRPTRLVDEGVVAQLRGTGSFSVTDLEQFGECSSMWFFERLIRPRDIDAEVDARLRGSVAHHALYRFYGGIPKRFGIDALDETRLEEAVGFLHECLADAVQSQVWMEIDDLALLELETVLARDLEAFVRQDVALGLPLVPRRLEVAFGSDRAPTELQRGLDLGGFTVSGKIDRIDVDPFSARGIVQDYKSGAAHSAVTIERDGKLQIPLYLLVLRDLVGVEPIGGLYRSLTGEREARGVLRAEEKDLLPGLARNDYLSEGDFWAVVDAAADRARAAVARIRDGDVGHDPREGECPGWCQLGPMCRVAKA